MNEQPDLPKITIVEAVEEPPSEPTPESLGLDLPEDPEAALPMALSGLAEARKEADAYLDDLRRVAADFDNYRKRSQREISAVIERASERVVTVLLPVLDSLDAALSVGTTSETEEMLRTGVRSTRDLLLDVLSKEGLEPIPTFGESFDPTLHEAVTSSGDGDGAELVITDEFRRGYRLKGKVLRASLVGVSPRQ